MSLAERFYDASDWRNKLDEWAARTFPDCAVTCKSTVPTLSNAVYAYKIKWNNNEKADLTALNDSLRRTLGPAVRMQHGDSNNEFTVNVMDMPVSAMEQIERIILQTQKVVESNVRTPLTFYLLVFSVLLANFVLSVVLLHNHWYAYQEPWETPLEFIWYHMPFVGGHAAHAH